MKTNKEDAYSPNQVLLTVLLAVSITTIFAGKSLWIPASHIENLHIRSIALALADSLSFVAAETGLDGYLPAAREGFLSVTGLAEQTEWDTRYFNRRASGVEASPSALSTASQSTVVETAEPSGLSPALPEAHAATATADAATDPADATIALAPVDAATGPAPADASPAPGAAIPSAVPANAIHSSANPLRLYMFGDSQVFSLGSGLSRLAGKDSPVSVDFLAVHSSGFIRGDYYNWPAKLADTLSSSRYDAVVMMLGMNDYQNFWNNRGEIMKKHTPEWEAAYAEKCSALIDEALLYVPKVYWVGMPRVKDPQYEQSLRYIDAVQSRVAARYGPDIVIRHPIADSLPGAAGSYAETVSLPSGKSIQAMSPDGNHFTVEGGQFAMAGLYRRLSQDWLFSEIPIEHLIE